MRAVAWWTCALFALASARIYERCELARELDRLGVEQEYLSTWVCIAFHESRFDTAANNRYSGDHGILQISELYWCGPGKACEISCSDLRDDNITDDLQCAQKIYEEHTRLQGNGFLAWVVYPQHCKHNTKKYLADCNSTYHKDSAPKIIDQPYTFKYDTNHSFSYELYPQVDDLKPPYFMLTTILLGSNKNKLEQATEHKEENVTNWVNYKIDNIDELKLPMMYKHLTTTTIKSTTTSTTTTSRPAVPRKQIYTNPFHVRPLMPTKTIEIKRVTPRSQHFFPTKVHSTTNPNFNHLLSLPPKNVTHKLITTVATVKPIPTRSTRYTVASGITTSPPKTIKHTTKVTKVTPPKATKLLPFVIKTTTTVTRLPFIFATSPSTRTLLTTTKTISDMGANKIFPFIYKDTKEEKRISSTSTRLTSPTTKAMPFIFIPSTTSSPKTTTSKRKPSPTNQSLTPLTKTPRTNVTKASSTKTTSVTKTTPVPRPTQSLFDLYLNPTTRPKLAPYRVPQENNSYKLKIFSDGTTTLVPTYQFRDKKIP